jgi:S1-C subfamily serine protease
MFWRSFMACGASAAVVFACEDEPVRPAMPDRVPSPAPRPPVAGTDRNPDVPLDLTPAEIAARSQPSIVLVATPDGFGAGFVVGGERVATCFHVVRGADKIVVRTSDEVPHVVTAVLAYDAAEDLALLEVDGLRAPPLPLGDSGELAAGDPVTVVGHPRGFEGTVSTGVLSGIRNHEGSRLFQITAPISPGSSGGPVFNARGQVVGITHGLIPDSQELNFATPAAQLKKLLRANATATPLPEFASATKEKPAPVEPQPVSAPEPPASGPQFPANVAGFTFGMTLAQLQQACPTVAFDQSSAVCPYAIVPLPFAAGGIRFSLWKGYVTAITIYPDSRPRAEAALFAKYGVPTPAKYTAAGGWATASRWASGSTGGEQWDFDEGYMIRLGSIDGKALFLTFVSGLYYRLQQENY